MPLKRLFAAVFIVGAALLALSGPVAAQPAACAEEDLRCRVTQLEARLDDLTRRLESPGATGVTSTPLATLFSLRATCRSNCEAEAQEACVARGFASGRPEDWERPRAGPVTLTRVRCLR